MAVCLQAREIMPPPPAIYSRACAFDDNSSAIDLTPTAAASLSSGSGFDGFGALQGRAVSGDMVFLAGGHPIDNCRFFLGGLWRSRRLLGGGRSLCGRCLFGCRGFLAAAGFAAAGAFTEGEGEGDGVGITVSVGVTAAFGDGAGVGNGVAEALGVCSEAEPQAQRTQETAKEWQTKQISA